MYDFESAVAEAMADEQATKKPAMADKIGFDPASPEATPRQVGFVFPASAKWYIFIILC